MILKGKLLLGKLYCHSHASVQVLLVNFWKSYKIDIFSLYVLFSHFRPRDVALENGFFHMYSFACAYVRITYEKIKGKIP